MRTNKAVPATPKGRASPRKRLLERAKTRGRCLYNLWYQYSPKLDRDVVLASDAAFDHFCWLEGDANVASYVVDPDPLSLCIDDQSVSARFDVQVTLRSGRPQLRDVDSRTEAQVPESQTQRRWAEQAGFDYLHVDLNLLRQHHQFIANWRRAIAFIAAARDWPLHDLRNDLALAASCAPRLTIGGLLLNFDRETQPLLLAALFRALQEGWLGSNLHEAPLSASTTVHRVEANACANN